MGALKRIGAALPLLLCMGNTCCVNGYCVGTVSGGTPTPPPTPLTATIDEDPDQIQATSSGLNYSCVVSSTNVSAPPTLWHVTFQNNAASPQDTWILWPKGQSTSSQYILNYYIAPNAGSVNSQLPTIAANAVQAWYTALQNYATGSLLFNIATSTDPASPVGVFADNSGSLSVAPDEGGGESFGTITTQQPLASTKLTSAQIVLSSYVAPGVLWASALHEIGHSLGYNHSAYAYSVMFPAAKNGCFTVNGTAVPASDTTWLEQRYDPVWAGGGGGGTSGSGCGSRPCPLTSRRGRTSMLASAYGGAPHSVAFRMADYQGTPRQRTLSSLYSSFDSARVPPIAAVHLEDHAGARTISAQTLYLTSSLAAQVQILGTPIIKSVPPYNVNIREARILQIYRHLLGPNADLTPGSIIYIVDRQPSSTGYFLDEPPMTSGMRAIVFLSPAPNNIGFGNIRPLFEESFKLVSRWGIDGTGRMFVAGSTTSVNAQQINGMPLANLEAILLGQSVQNAAKTQSSALTAGSFNEQRVLTELLRARGISGPAALAKYAEQMRGNRGMAIKSSLAKEDSRRWLAAHVLLRRP